MTLEDYRALTPPIYQHENPIGNYIADIFSLMKSNKHDYNSDNILVRNNIYIYIVVAQNSFTSAEPVA